MGVDPGRIIGSCRGFLAQGIGAFQSDLDALWIADAQNRVPDGIRRHLLFSGITPISLARRLFGRGPLRKTQWLTAIVTSGRLKGLMPTV